MVHKIVIGLSIQMKLVYVCVWIFSQRWSKSFSYSHSFSSESNYVYIEHIILQQMSSTHVKTKSTTTTEKKE